MGGWGVNLTVKYRIRVVILLFIFSFLVDCDLQNIFLNFNLKANEIVKKMKDKMKSKEHFAE